MCWHRIFRGKILITASVKIYLLGKNNVTLKPPNTTLKVTAVNYEDGFLFLNIIKKLKPSTTDTGSMK